MSLPPFHNGYKDDGTPAVTLNPVLTAPPAVGTLGSVGLWPPGIENHRSGALPLGPDHKGVSNPPPPGSTTP